jgi:hypothetical protein
VAIEPASRFPLTHAYQKSRKGKKQKTPTIPPEIQLISRKNQRFSHQSRKTAQAAHRKRGFFVTIFHASRRIIYH